VKKIARKQASKLLAENPSPSASAFIEADGDVGAAPPPTNIASADVTAQTTGARCFQLPFAPRSGAGNSLADIQDDTVISMDLVPPFIACPADAEAEVRTTDAQTGIENEAFLIQFDK
jgi:hypothetical protein